MNSLTAKLQSGVELTSEEIRGAAGWLLEEPSNERAIAERVDLLLALAEKGETPAEIAGFVEIFLERAVDPGLAPAEVEGPLVDLCGTGGDRLGLFNVSTTAMFPVAAAGGVVVKHGNRGITSRSGGADVLEALGIAIDVSPAAFVETVKRTRLGFLFAPLYHPAFRAVVPVRQELAARGQHSIFNILGPLLNPSRPVCQLTGVFAPELTEVFADILARLGRRSAWAVHGTTAEGLPMDELSTQGPTRISSVREGSVESSRTLQAAELSFATASVDALTGGDAARNATLLLAILSGEDRGPKRDLTVLNAGAALVVCDLAPDLPSGIALAAEKIDDGSALARLRALQGA